MGNAQVSRVDEPRLLLTDYSDLAFQESLGSYKLFKIMKCVHEREGVVLVKLFIQREGAPDLQDVKQRILKVREAFRSHWLHPNVVPYQGMDIAAQSAILLRPHFARDLYDRMHTRPFLSELMKGWIAFQVICSVCQAHANGVVHGDLKTENVFVSSWNHAVLSDFAGFKPLRLPENDPSEFSFFFESDLNRRRCYLAPERFDTTSSNAGRQIMYEAFTRELAATDIFSLGCVLAELYLDGQTLMDLPELLRYRSGQLDLQTKIAGIKNAAVQEIISSMLARDPAQRKPATAYLKEWSMRVAPRCFGGCLYPLSVLMLQPVYQQPDMRVALIRHNFANILWCLVGPAKLAEALGLPEGKPASVPVWRAWQAHVGRHVRSTDEAMLHGSVHAAVQTAAQWLEPEAAAELPPVDILDEARQGGHGIVPRLAHPWLREFVCDGFMRALLDHWEQGCGRCAASGKVGSGELEGSPVYAALLNELCGHGQEGELPGPGAVPGAEQEDVLSILCGVICACLQHLSHPRLRITCLDMFEQLAPFASQHTVLEQIVPYCHLLMTDQAAKVRARAICVVTIALSRVKELPAGDTALFMEYLLPQLLSAMGGMRGEPVVLLAIASNIGALARHATRFAELSIEAVNRSGSASPAAGEQTGSKKEIEAFDVQCKHLREAVKRIVKGLLECLPAGPQQAERPDAGEATLHEESLVNLAAGRDVKIALLRNMCVLADSFGREDTHNFLLPYLISFMNDPAWEVRAAFCEEAALLPRKVGQVSTEGIIWPCYEQALLDQEERVLQAALSGLKTLAKQKVLQRQLLVTVAAKVAPLLVHPSTAVRRCSLQVFDGLGEQLSAVDQYVFVMPALRPLLKLEISELKDMSLAFLVAPLARRSFKRVLLRRDEAVHEAMVQRKPLPRPGDDADVLDEDHNWDALELFRPYLQLLLRSRPSMAQLSGLGDERNTCSALVQGLRFFAVNPYCAPNCSLQARTLLDEGHEWLQAAAQGARPHPLGLFSAQAFLAQALCLPTKPRDLGSLNSLDGTPYSLYAAASNDAAMDLPDPPGEIPEERRAGSQDAGWRRLKQDDPFGVDWDRRTAAQPATWRPQGVLLATLYEYAHQSGVPVVKVDATDDSRVLVTGGKDGVVKLWSCAQLERDVAVSSTHTFSRPGRLRALRTVRNAKAVAVGTQAGEVYLYRLVPSRGGASAVELCHFAAGDEAGACAVTCMEHFDTELDSVVVFAQQHGAVQGWDLRSRAPCWSGLTVPPWLGAPSCLSLASDGHGLTVGTLGGGLLLYDLRFLAPWRQWRVSSGAAVLALKGANPSPGVFAALAGDCNEVALFDAARGSCLTLFLTEGPREAAISVPTLLAAQQPTSHAALPEWHAGGCVRCLWMPPRGPQSFLLAGGTDRKVRHWSLDPERHAAEAYVVTPQDPALGKGRERVSYSSNHLGDVFVVQEQAAQGTKAAEVGEAEEARPPNPNHRDAILDMCSISLQHDILVTAGRDGLVKLWK